MGSQLFRSWLSRLAHSPLASQRSRSRETSDRPEVSRLPLQARRPASPFHRARLKVERFEERDVPSASIPLNAQTWTAVGPSPITQGQSPGGPSSTGRINGIAVDPTDTNVMYAASDNGGIWRTIDGGKTGRPGPTSSSSASRRSPPSTGLAATRSTPSTWLATYGCPPTGRRRSPNRPSRPSRKGRRSTR